MFPKFIIHTTLYQIPDKTAVVVLLETNKLSVGPILKEIIQLEEPIKDFPSEHLITQLMLVAG